MEDVKKLMITAELGTTLDPVSAAMMDTLQTKENAY